MPSYSDFKYLQKVNAKCPQISDEKKKFCLFDKWLLILILKDQKFFVKGAKLFFSSEIWGHFAFIFCRYLKSEYEGIYLLQVLSIRIWGYLPSAGKYLQILRAIPWIFETKFFPLKSAFRCPHLTTVRFSKHRFNKKYMISLFRWTSSFLTAFTYNKLNQW